MFTKEKNYLSFILTPETLKIIHLKIFSSEYKLINVIKRDVRQVTEEELPKVLRSAFEEFDLKKPQIIGVVPSQLITTKNIEIPSIDPQEIKSIIDLQAGRHTPYSREEILVGYIPIGVFQKNYTKVLLIIVNRNHIKKQLDLFERVGIKINQFLFAPEGIARFYAKILNIKEEDIPVGIINISNQITDFIIEYNKTVATYRSIPLGMSHLIKEGAPTREKLVAELLSSLESYQNDDINRLPETYLLTSDDAKIKELQPILQEKLKANIKITPFLDHLKANQDVLLKLVSEYNDDSFLETISNGLLVDQIQVDLMPEEVKMQRAIEEKGRQLIKSGIYIFVFLILSCCLFFFKLYFRSLMLDQLTEEYKKKHKAIVILDRVAQKTRIIKDYLNSRMVGLDVMSSIYQMIPDEMYLENVMLDDNGTITLQGIADSTSIVFNFVTALQESTFFKAVETKSTTTKKDRGKDVTAFEISFKLASAKDEVQEEVDAPVSKEEKPKEKAGKK